MNENIPGINEAVRRDGAFLGLVMPEVLRAMLVRALIVDSYDPADEGGDWGEVMQFVHGFYDEPLTPDQHTDERVRCMEWIDGAVAAFTKRRFHASDRYAATLAASGRRS